MADDDGRLARLWQQVPEEVRAVVRDEAAVVSRELRAVRSAGQLRRKLEDPDLVARVAEPLSPALDRISGVVARTSIPMGPRSGHALVTASATVGATLSSGLEVLGTLGLEAPPAAASAFAAAGTAGVVTGLLEFYATAATIVTELRAAGRHDEPALVRRALLHAYLGTGGGPPGTGPGSDGTGRRMAVAVLRRAGSRWIPIAGVPVSVTRANQDLRRARAYARYLATEPRSRR